MNESIHTPFEILPLRFMRPYTSPGRIPLALHNRKRHKSYSVIEQVHHGKCFGEKKIVKRGCAHHLKATAQKLFCDPEGELLHSPHGPSVKDSDDTSKRAFFYFKPAPKIVHPARPKKSIFNFVLDFLKYHLETST